MVRAFDLFCGSGGSSHGAALAGVTVAGGADLWSLAMDVFQDNFADALPFVSRTEDLDPSVVRRRTGPIDLLLASPECTNHSCARGNRPRSEASRETALQVLRFANIWKPRWLVLENVIHMRPWSRYRELLETLRDEGYHVREQVLDASDFGVPQKRKRLFLLCDRETEPKAVISGRRGRRKIANSILDPEGTWKVGPLYTEKRAAATLERAKNGFQAIGHDTPFLLVYYGSDGCGGWQRLDRPLRTITTLDRFGLVQPTSNGPMLRMLQVPELKRAMGFCENYRIDRGSRRERIKMLGNAVCPPVMTAIVKSIIT